MSNARQHHRHGANGCLSSAEVVSFRRSLLDWFDRSQRDLPWRRTRDPYAIWISEVMLQQTRVAVVIPFYKRFLDRFPDFTSLAAAPEADLLSHWAGLGYYHRARNLQRAARIMQQRGSFPSSYEEILELPGIGAYTSAAIASIAFNLPHASVDGNVLRVFSRICADSTDIASTKGHAHFASIAARFIDKDRPGAFNQAVMELGATLCLPRNPQCLICPVAEQCRARQSHRQMEFPIKLARSKGVREHRTFLWIERAGNLLLWQRPPDSRLMPGFWELPEKGQLPNVALGEWLGSFRHTITFHNYTCEVYKADIPKAASSCRWISIKELSGLPASTLLRKAQRMLAKGSGPAANTPRQSRKKGI